MPQLVPLVSAALERYCRDEVESKGGEEEGQTRLTTPILDAAE